MTRETTRRLFLRNISCGTLGAASLHLPAFAQTSSSAVSLRIDRRSPGPVVPSGFIGLSYENMQLEDPSFFSPKNKSLIEQFRSISSNGVLRLGGNTSEFGWWKANSSDIVPKRTDSPWKASGEPTAATVFAITPEAIDNLDGFLSVTGWTCIYGLNLGYGTVAADLPEAKFVYGKLGARLEYFQVGNEVDIFRGHLRDPQTWNVDRYLQEWLAIARAVQKALPGSRFGMPDVASDVRWLTQIAERWAAIPDKPNVVTLSHHYYWSGPPSNPQANVENLLQRDPKVAPYAAISSSAAQKIGAPVTWRMTEGNTVYRGGKYGVSDVFAAALWTADYLLQMMSLGYAGVNLHGGSGHAQAVSVAGVFHGEALMKNPEAPHPKPFYTPIANEGTLAGAGVNGELNATYLLEPVGYGMKFVAAFAGATMLPVLFEDGGKNLTAYAARRPDGTIIAAIFNKDRERQIAIHAPRALVFSRLIAPSLESRDARIVTVNEQDADHIDMPAYSGAIMQIM